MSHQASGQFIPGQGEDDGELIIQGEYSYIGDDGQTYTVKYIAVKVTILSIIYTVVNRRDLIVNGVNQG